MAAYPEWMDDGTVQAFIDEMDNGAKEGYVFRYGDRGFGYYTESEAAMALNASKLASERECDQCGNCLLYTSPSPRDQRGSRMPSSA